MDKTKEWFDEAVKYRVRVYSVKDSDYILYKGFKISKFHDGEHLIQDIRLTDFYTEVEKEHLAIINTKGFIRGADDISYERNVIRVDDYTKKIETLYGNLEDFEKNKNKKPSFYAKKIENCQKNIHNYVDLMFFYKAQIEQYKNKYKLN